MFLSTLDTDIIGIAVSGITENFNSVNSIGVLVLTSYSLMLCGMILIFGKLSSRYGSILVFNVAISLFLVSLLPVWG